jgi:hypothetical protein
MPTEKVVNTLVYFGCEMENTNISDSRLFLDEPCLPLYPEFQGELFNINALHWQNIKALLISIFHPTLQILTRKFVSSCV